MKKLIAVLLAVLTLSALSLTAFAAQDDSAAAEQENTTQQENAAAQEQTTQITAKLTEADALAAALKDAGLKEADVTVTKNKLSEKQTSAGDKIAVYSISFNTSDTTYKYYLDANTGTVYYRDVTFQSPDVVFKGHGHGEKGGRGGKKGMNGGNTNTNGENTGTAPAAGQSAGVS